MKQIRYSIISLHRRKNHILGLSIITLLLLLVQIFLNNISLGEGIYVNNQVSKTVVEGIGLIFILYFGSTTRDSIVQSKILHLFRAKKQNAHNIIGGIISALISIIVLYVTVSYVIIYLTGSLPLNEYITTGIGTMFVLSTISIIVVLCSLLTNTYIAFMSGAIIYCISYSINFIITSLQYQENSEGLSYILYGIQFILPRFDLLTSGLYSTNNRALAIISHIIIISILYYISIRVFSYRYTTHENIIDVGYQS